MSVVKPMEIEKLFYVPNSRLAESYSRCRDSGVSPIQVKARIALKNTNLESIKKNSVCFQLLPQIESLLNNSCRLVKNSKVLVVVTNELSHLLLVLGHSGIINVLRHEHNIRPWTSLCEESIGTNAVSLALMYREMQSIQGSDHYCQIFNSWSGVASPIIAFGSELLGSICIATLTLGSLYESIILTSFLAAKVTGLAEAHFPNLERYKTDSLAQRNSVLTDRQIEVLRLFSRGFSYKEIASKLCLVSSKTVEEHLDAISRRLSVRKRRECILQAAKLGLL